MKMIVAVDQHWGIGRQNGLLFSIREDMRFFKNTTMGGTVIMGAKTLLSLPGGRPLPGRENIVLSRKGNFTAEGVALFRSADALFDRLRGRDTSRCYVIGGAAVYNLLMDYCDTAYVTKVDADGQAEVFLRDMDAQPNWTLTACSSLHRQGPLSFRFCTYCNETVKPM